MTINEYIKDLEETANSMANDDPIFKNEYERLKKAHDDKSIDAFPYRNMLSFLIENNSPIFNNDDSKEKIFTLIDNINKAEEEIKKSNKWLYRIAMIEIPTICISILIVYCIFHYKFDFKNFMYVSIGALIVFVIHTYFILRFYQQSVKTSKELLEKRLGALYLNIAINNPRLEKIISIGIYMFLGHHGKSTEPFGPDDSPIKQIADYLKKNDNK